MTAPATERAIYLDSSALVKLVVAEPESPALVEYLADQGAWLTSSRLAVVEVPRAVRAASADPRWLSVAQQVLGRCVLIDVSRRILDHAARLASASLRSLEAIHLASALGVGPMEVIAYDRRLGRAASESGLRVRTPGITG